MHQFKNTVIILTIFLSSITVSALGMNKETTIINKGTFSLEHFDSLRDNKYRFGDDVLVCDKEGCLKKTYRVLDGNTKNGTRTITLQRTDFWGKLWQEKRIIEMAINDANPSETTVTEYMTSKSIPAPIMVTTVFGFLTATTAFLGLAK